MILMQLSFNELQYVVGTPETVEKMPEARVLRPFDDDVVAFLNDLSGLLRTCRTFPDVATFGGPLSSQPEFSSSSRKHLRFIFNF